MILWFYKFLDFPSAVFFLPSRWIPDNLIVSYTETISYILGFSLRVHHCLQKFWTGFLQSSQKFSPLWEKQVKHTDCNPLVVKEAKFYKVFERDLIRPVRYWSTQRCSTSCFQERRCWISWASSQAQNQWLAREINEWGKMGTQRA